MLTVERLKEVLSYDQISGDFTWLVTLSGKGERGTKAGTISKRHKWTIGIDGSRYLAHRLAWFYMTGKWPQCEIDHVDVDCANNSWHNLRQSNRSQNNANRKIPSTNKTGFKNVIYRRDRSRYVAIGKINGKSKHLGCFCTAEEANIVAQEFAQRTYGEFARAN